MPDAPRKLFIAPTDLGDLITEKTVEPEDRQYLTGYTRDDDHAAVLAENERLREAIQFALQALNSSHFKNAEHIRASLKLSDALKPGEP